MHLTMTCNVPCMDFGLAGCNKRWKEGNEIAGRLGS